MGEDYKPSESKDKDKRYAHVYESIKAVIDPNTHPLSNMSNCLAVLKEEFNWWWIGYYFVHGNKPQEQVLALGPFQGPLACTIIKRGKGICGSSWDKQKVIIVEDVESFEGHIACSSLSKSEIVVPIYSGEKCIGVLDIDSQKYSEFDKIDEDYLTKILHVLDEVQTWKWIEINF